MIDYLMQSSVFWTIVGIASAIVIALVAVCFPLSKNIDKTNQKKSALILFIILILILIVLGLYIYFEHQEFLKQNVAKTEDFINENDDYNNQTNKTTQKDTTTKIPEVTIQEPVTTKIPEVTIQEPITTKIPEVNIPDIYNENGYVINGIFGCKNYQRDIFFKYNEKSNEYEGFSKSQIKCQLYEANLYFIDNNGNYLNNCNISIGVPNAQSYSEMTYQGIFLNYSYKTSNSLFFQEGLYSFDIETISGERYSSDYVYINSEKDYYINVQQFL